MTSNASIASGPASFSSGAKGTAPQALDTTLAKLCADVYRDPGQTVEGWTPVPEDALRNLGFRASDLINRQSGFHARIYANGEGSHIVVFRGTNEGKDWKHNTRQGIGLEDPQYEQAVNLAVRSRKIFGDNIVFSGHSLGGGLASAASVATGMTAVTFNSAGLHDNAFERLGLDPGTARVAFAGNGQIRRYAVDNEILTDLQEHRLLTRYLLPDAIGRRIDLPDPDPMPEWKRLIPGASLKHGVDVHGMDAVLRAQAMAQPSLTDAAHPGHTLYRQSLDGLRKVDPAPTGLQSDRDYQNAAAALAVEAASTGLQRIDHVVPSREGARAFAVEGRLDDAAHRVAGIDIRESTRQPMEASTARFPSVAPEPTAPDLTRRPALSY